MTRKHLNKFSISVFVIITFFVTSCQNREQEEKEKEEIEKKEAQIRKNEIDSINKNNVDLLLKRTQAEKIDFEKHNYSYELQNIFDKTTQNFCFSGIIDDIIKNDTSYTLVVKDYYYKMSFTINIEASIQIFEKIKTSLNNKYDINEGYFIINNIRLKKIPFVLKSKTETSEENDSNPDSEITIDYNGKFFKIEGKLIDYYIVKEENE